MAVKPLSDRVLVKPNPAEEKTAGGLFIPDTAKEKPLMGKVVAAGPGTADIKMEVKVGDEVLYGKYAGTELNIDGVSYLMMAQRDISLSIVILIARVVEIHLVVRIAAAHAQNRGLVRLPLPGLSP